MKLKCSVCSKVHRSARGPMDWNSPLIMMLGYQDARGLNHYLAACLQCGTIHDVVPSFKAIIGSPWRIHGYTTASSIVKEYNKSGLNIGIDEYAIKNLDIPYDIIKPLIEHGHLKSSSVVHKKNSDEALVRAEPAVQDNEEMDALKIAIAQQKREEALNRTKEIGRDGRFIAYAADTVLDMETKLMWASRDNGSDVIWPVAKSICENYLGGGYADWRMPRQDELAGLYESKKGYEVTQSNGHKVHLTGLIQLTGGWVWSSEMDGSHAAAFDFSSGARKMTMQSWKENQRALPVRFAK